jgi:hypothetical protein
MWTDVFWPFAVVLFELLVFGITLYLARRFTRSHDAEWGTLESPPGAQVEAPAQPAKAPARAEREAEPAAHGREPVGAA